jgi:hypothetical protein
MEFKTTEGHIGKLLRVKLKEVAPRAGFELATLRLTAGAAKL